MKKLVLKLDLHDDKQKQKAMMAVSGLPRVDSISMDMKEKKLTVIGDMNPVTVVRKLRKNWPSTEIVSDGQAKEPEKKKEDGKKDDGKKDDDKKKLTVIGDMDPVTVVSKLRKNWPSTENVSVGQAKETEKKKKKETEKKKKKESEKKKKKEDGKKDDGKKDDDKKKDQNEQYLEFMKTYGPSRAPMSYYAHSVEENPNTCVIS